MEMETNTAQVVADLVKGLVTQKIDIITHDGVTAPVMIASKPGGGFEIQSVKPHLDQYRTAPERRTGTAIMSTIGSFIEHVNRFRDDDSALFGDRDPIRPSLLAVLDYHCKTAKGSPRFGLHRTSFSFPLSDEWKSWADVDGKKMSQSDFAEFIEDRISDIAPPPDFTGEITESDTKLKEFITLLGGNVASPSKMVELSRGLSVHVGERVKQAVNLSSGEGQIQYESEHKDSEGAALKVPNLFLVAIPVFEGGDLYRIPVRLRYRAAAGQISWFFEMYRADKVFKHAFDEACDLAAKETSLTLLSGFPEATR